MAHAVALADRVVQAVSQETPNPVPIDLDEARVFLDDLIATVRRARSRVN